MLCCHGLFLQIGAHEHNLLKISQNHFMAFRDMSIMLEFVFLSILISEERTVCQPGSHTAGKIKLHQQLMTTINISKLGRQVFLLKNHNTHITNLTDHFQLSLSTPMKVLPSIKKNRLIV